MPALLIPAILKTKEAHLYVGGVEVWKDLVKHYAEKLKPIRTTQRGDSYFRTATIDHVIVLAEMEGKLIFNPDAVGTLPDKSRRKLQTHLNDA
jgi:hypothetical protein